MATAEQSRDIPKSESWRMFNQISPRYDFLNHLLSFGLDIRWRKKLIKFLPERDDQLVLDVATGTGDVLITLVEKGKNVRAGCGIDMANRMLNIGREKVAKRDLAQKIVLKYGNANAIPYEKNSFDCATIAFGIRNVEDPKQVLREMHRTLKKGGRSLILEFSLPRNPVLYHLHMFYLRFFVPLVGFLFSGHYRAYKYLNETIEEFPYGDDFCKLMEDCGYANIEAHTLMGGIATIYQGDKP